jgi:cytochrome P450
VKVLVLGGGIAGVTAAYFIARDGHEVTLVEAQDALGPEKAAYPPGPRPGWFGFSILADFRKDPLEQLDRLHREYGDAVSYRVGPYRQYLFFHPDQVRELLVSKARSFRRFPPSMRVLRQWNGESMLIAEGDQWLRKRRLVQPAFQPKRLAEYLPAMWAEALKQCDRWQTLLARAEGEKVTLDVVPEMNNLTGVFFRQALEDVEIGGWQLRKGDLAGSYSWVTQRDPRWFPEPAHFDPDRFLAERFARLPAGSYFPFGTGPRMCIGSGMATLEIQAALAAFVQRFRFAVPAGRSATSADWTTFTAP